MGLEVRDGRNGKIDVPPPPGCHRVSAESCVAVALEEPEEGLPHLVDGVRPVGEALPEKGIFLARSIAAVRLIRVLAPEVITAAGALFSYEIVLSEERKIEPGHEPGNIKQILKV